MALSYVRCIGSAQSQLIVFKKEMLLSIYFTGIGSFQCVVRHNSPMQMYAILGNAAVGNSYLVDISFLFDPVHVQG